MTEKQSSKTDNSVTFYNNPNPITTPDNYVEIFLWLNGKPVNCAFKYIINNKDTLPLNILKEEIMSYILENKELYSRFQVPNIKSQSIYTLYLTTESKFEESDISYLKKNDLLFFTFDNTPFKSSNHFLKYEFIKWIKSGGYGKVFLAKNVFTEQEYAIKQIDISNFSIEDIYNISRENLILRNFSHKNVIKCHDSFAHDNKFFTVMDYAAGAQCEYHCKRH